MRMRRSLLSLSLALLVAGGIAATALGETSAHAQTSAEDPSRTTSTSVVPPRFHRVAISAGSTCSSIAAACTHAPVATTKLSSVHRGQVGQPRPDPVSRTAPPVTTIAPLAIRLASAIRETTAEETGTVRC